MPRLFKLPLLLSALSFVGCLAGCQTVFQSLYGMHGMRTVPAAEVQQLAKRYAIPPDQVFVLDTSYVTFLTALDRQSPATAKNHFQPLQASYYGRNGQLLTFYINCYAGGFPNLTWNAGGGLNQFPPAPQAPLDTALALPAYLRFVRLPDGRPVPPTPPADYTVVVQWSRFMGRQSKRFIQKVQRNTALASKGQTVRLLFVNNDNADMYMGR